MAEPKAEVNFWVRVPDPSSVAWAFIEEEGEGGPARVWGCGRESKPECADSFDDLGAAADWMVGLGYEPLWGGALARALPPASGLAAKGSALQRLISSTHSLL